MHFLTPYLFDVSAPVCAEPAQTEPSMTVPDQSLTVAEILDRYTRGIAPPCAHTPIYDDRDDLGFDDVNPVDRPDFDLSDIDANRRQLEIFAAQMKEDGTKKSTKKVKASEEAKEQPPPAVGPVSEAPEA
jgi:hypothetical protein